MGKVIKKFILLAIAAGIVYGLLSYHIVFYGTQVEFLPKSEYTFEWTFVNVAPTEFRTPKEILKHDDLRRDGIGAVMVDFGIITQEERMKLEERIRQQQWQ
jgi:hypothetical protein